MLKDTVQQFSNNKKIIAGNGKDEIMSSQLQKNIAMPVPHNAKQGESIGNQSNNDGLD